MSISKLFCILLTLGLVGCVNPHVKPNLSATELTNDGIAYFSTASIEECTVHSVYLALKKESDEQILNLAKSQFFVTNRYVEKDYPESRGLFQIVSLPAGSYYFWFVQRHPMLDVDYEEVLSPFKIEKGEVKYLGEIRVDGCLDIAVDIGDEYDRDTSKLRFLYPDIGQLKPLKELIKLKQ